MEACALEKIYSHCLALCGIDTPQSQYIPLPKGMAAFASRRFDRQGSVRIPMQTLAAFTGADYRIPGSLDYDVTYCEGPAGYHQMDIMGEALDISRQALLRLGVEEAGLSQQQAVEMIEKYCDIAARFHQIAADLLPDCITQETLNHIQRRIDGNLRHLDV